jgi:hypothetical protein
MESVKSILEMSLKISYFKKLFQNSSILSEDFLDKIISIMDQNEAHHSQKALTLFFPKNLKIQLQNKQSTSNFQTLQELFHFLEKSPEFVNLSISFSKSHTDPSNKNIIQFKSPSHAFFGISENPDWNTMEIVKIKRNNLSIYDMKLMSNDQRTTIYFEKAPNRNGKIKNYLRRIINIIGFQKQQVEFNEDHIRYSTYKNKLDSGSKLSPIQMNYPINFSNDDELIEKQPKSMYQIENNIFISHYNFILNLFQKKGMAQNIRESPKTQFKRINIYFKILTQLNSFVRCQSPSYFEIHIEILDNLDLVFLINIPNLNSCQLKEIETEFSNCEEINQIMNPLNITLSFVSTPPTIISEK